MRLTGIFGRNGARNGKASHVPPKLLDAVVCGDVNGESLDAFWCWLGSRSRVKPHDGLPEEWCALSEASTCDDPLRLGTLANHQNPWVRLAVASNKATPAWAVWGDGINGFGLVDDSDDWVAAAALLAMPKPPSAVIEAMAAASGSAPYGSTSVVAAPSGKTPQQAD